MAPTDHCLASMARLSLSMASRPAATAIPRFLVPLASQARRASGISALTKAKAKKEKKKKAVPKHFTTYDIAKSPMQQFSLLDAMRYLRAYEVGRPPQTVKYELAIRLRTTRGGPVIKSRIRLPHPVRTDMAIGVICPDGSEAAQEALRNGAVVAGDESVFEAIRREEIPFNRLICQEDSEPALQKAGLGRILGPKGLMPSRKTGTVVTDVRRAIRQMAGADDYRERVGCLRLPIGQLGFTPEMLSDNIKAFLEQVKKECVDFDDQFHKKVHEVVLSTSHGPGFSLNGLFKSVDAAVTSAQLSSVM